MARCLRASIAVALACAALPAPAADGVSAPALDAALNQSRQEVGAPGASAAVIQHGQVLWAGASGVASLGGPPVTTTTPFITASTAKTVTAAMVLRLVDEGRLRLRQRVGRLLPGLRGGRWITVRNLLEHSSGLPDYLYSRSLNRTLASDPQHHWTRAEVMRVIRRPTFVPGRHFSYSNSNYVALGGIVERIERAGFETAFERLLAGPLGLTESTWRYDNALLGQIAHPYIERRGVLADQWAAGYIGTDYLGEVWNDGGLATTASELGRIANTLIAGSLLGRSSRRAMLTFGHGGAGLGVFPWYVLGRNWIGHDGLYGGFTSQHWTNRDGLTIAVLTNLETAPSRPDASVAIFKALARTALAP